MSAAAAGRPNAADAGSVDARNPWPGLASFREADREFFHGRAAEAEALLRLLRRARLTVLFGLSGLGKTSLLRAGIFPRIRDDDVLPVEIRLEYTTGSPALADQVRQAVVEAAAEAGVDGAGSLDGATLWETFHRRGVELWSERHKLVVPLLVFDQFEEIFTLGSRDLPTRATSEAFLEELADLIEARPPETLKARIEDEPKIARDFNFGRHPYRVMLSLREDFLPQLEELRARIGSLAHHRFRLRRMNGEAALSVVAQNPELIEPAVAERVVRFVAADTDAPLEQLQVEPALLSVVCRELNNRRRQRGESRITSDLLEERREEILAGIYERSVADVPEQLRTFVEERLLTVSGYRDSVALENALERPGISREHLDRLVDRRLLRIEERAGVQRVELTHDLLTGVVARSRDQRRRREQEEQQRQARLAAEAEAAESRRRQRSRRTAAAFGLLALVSLGLAGWALRAQRSAEEAKADAERQAIAAEKARAAADNERQKAEQAETDAKRQASAAELARAAADNERQKAEQAEADAKRQASAAEDARSAAVRQRKRATNLAAQVRANAILIAAEFHSDPLVRTLLLGEMTDAIEPQRGLHAARRAVQEAVPLAVLRGHEGYVLSVAFSPSGDHIVTGSRDDTARIWKADGSDRDAPVVLQAHKADVYSVAFSPSGDHIVTGSRDATARIWRASWPALLAYLREVTTECLTPEQRGRYLGESASEALGKYQECERSHGRGGTQCMYN